jgi:hypothetical protein
MANVNNMNQQIPKTYKLANSNHLFTEFDAVFGQGGRANQYRNGTKFRQLIIQHSDAYSSIPSRESSAKHQFVHQQIVAPLVASGGRFFCLQQGTIKELKVTDTADARIMMTKIQQALRDERKRTRAHLRQKDAVAAKKKPPSSGPTKAGPYDTVFGENAQAINARKGSVFEKLISTLSETYFAMDQQYKHHAPYTKYDFAREQIVKPLMQQGGRFFYVKGGELKELKYHENADCKIIMARIQKEFEQKRTPMPEPLPFHGLPQQQHHQQQQQLYRQNLHSFANSATPQASHTAAAPGAFFPAQALSRNGSLPGHNAQGMQNMTQHNYHNSNAYPVIGATDTAMEQLRAALQPSFSKASTQSPSAMSSGTTDSGQPSMPALTGTNVATPSTHDLGADFDSHYSRNDTFFGSGLDHYHQKSAFCSLVTQHSPAYNSIPSQDFRTRQEFVFNMIMEPLLASEPGGRFFVLQSGVLKELDLYDEIDCRILLTNIQQAFYDESKRRKKRSAPAPAPNKAAASADDHDEDDDSDDGMFSDAEEGTVQPVLGIHEESVHALFETLRDKIQLTV